jgi:hypothetical protein
VAAKTPYFPRPVSAPEKVTMLREIVSEMHQFLRDSGLNCHAEGEVITVTRNSRKWLWPAQRSWRLLVEYDAVSAGQSCLLYRNLDVFLSLRRIPASVRDQLAAQRVMWIDVEQKERADQGNELGEEVAMYLRRFGVRLLRVRGPGLSAKPEPVSDEPVAGDAKSNA